MKRWSWHMGRLFDIDIYVHATFLLLVGWIAFVSYDNGGSLWLVADGLAFLGLAFGIVLLHELGHALAARRYGIPTADITLYPIGGVARLERMPRDPRQELVVAIAGPAVNLVLAAGLAVILALSGGIPSISELGIAGSSLLGRLMWINVTLLVFNMLPAFPMDGGRVLRALMALRLDYARATIIAGRVGQFMAALFAIAGLYASPMLFLVAMFVWFAAQQEIMMARHGFFDRFSADIDAPSGQYGARRPSAEEIAKAWTARRGQTGGDAHGHAPQRDLEFDIRTPGGQRLRWRVSVAEK